MNSPHSANEELLQIFVKNVLQKIQELNGTANVLMKEGPKPELLEAIYRTTLTIKSFASTCNLNNIVTFITANIDTQFNKIRAEGNAVISEEHKQQIKNNIAMLRNMVNELRINGVDKDSTENTAPVDGSSVSSDKRVALLHAIGQLSVWSFHDLLNSLAKIEGFSDMINGISNFLY